MALNFGRLFQKNRNLFPDKQLVWSNCGYIFTSQSPDVNDIIYSGGRIIASADSIIFRAPITLPENARITSIVCSGAAVGETWILNRYVLDGGGFQNMTTATSFNTVNTNITYPIVDTAKYSYFIDTSSLDTDDLISGVKVEYTLQENR